VLVVWMSSLIKYVPFSRSRSLHHSAKKLNSNFIRKRQRINSPAFVFSAALPPLLAVSASESISLLKIPLDSTTPAHPLASLPENVRTLRALLDPIQSIDIPSDPSSPLIHISVRSKATSSKDTTTAESTREENETLLQAVVDECASNGVLVTRTKRNWEQEMIEQRPSLRICVTSALTKKEMEKAGMVLKNALIKVLGKGKK
jgi:serine palmitoyltransferase